MDDKTITASYKKTTKSYHHFNFDGGQGVIGSIYIAKGDTIPERITIELKIDRDKVNKRVEVTREEFNKACMTENRCG